MAQHKSSKEKPVLSQTLHRTLQDLESAISDWDRLGQEPVAAQSHLPAKAPAAGASSADEELRERTKRLLAELKRQISDLSD